MKPTYEDLRQIILAHRGDGLTDVTLDNDCLEALINLGILVRVGGNRIEVTTHGDRLHTRLSRGEHVGELD